MIDNTSKYTQLIKTEAKRLGFLSCGISKTEFLEEEAPRLEAWLNRNMHGKMTYMENHFDKRLNPILLVEGSKSVISFEKVNVPILIEFFFFRPPVTREIREIHRI